jgi:hypothetical protein
VAVNWEQAGICAVQWSSRKERKSHEEVFSQVQRLSSSHQHSLNLPGRKARPAFSRTLMHLLKQQHLTTCRQTSLVAMIFREEFRRLIIVLAAMAVGLVVKEKNFTATPVLVRIRIRRSFPLARRVG